ncbi:MAG: DUF2752 domain-containing protein [Treponema sp.]|nr:DUF2752 domain-containing protein [Treponema sp.]
MFTLRRQWTTRAVWSIIHFRINDALAYNRLSVVSFPLLAGCVISWICKHDSQKEAPKQPKRPVSIFPAQ